MEIQSLLTAVPALGPENGGQGELEKAAAIEALLSVCHFDDILHVNSEDVRVASGLRPNIVARLYGETPRTLWLFGHMDVVPAGQGWQTDPWRACRKDDWIYGRGVEDNQQAITSMLLLAEGLRSLAITPPLTLGLVFMADEECGSRHGLAYLLKQAPELFDKNDLYIVPDGGTPDASSIEIAEKAQLWLKFTVHGRQCHASAPQNGVNALVIASRLIGRLAELDKIFPARNELFMPPYSTFVPTRHDANVSAVNILPGKDVFYLDCRLLPGTAPETVRNEVDKIVAETVADSGARVDVKVEHCQDASQSPADAAVVTSLEQAIAAVYGVKATPCGIGGATVAAFLRKAGLPAAVWSCIANTCHQPDERSSLSATCKDAAVFAHVLMAQLTNAS